jgi:RimJ/RimL family protein N-acetyltransferase
VIIFQTERLRISRFTEADAPFIIELTNTEGWYRNIGDRNTRTEEGALNYLRKGPFNSYEKTGFGLWKLALQDDVPVGICGIFKRDAFDHPDIGYAILPAFEGKGYITEAAMATKQHALEQYGITNLIGITEPANTASINVLLKIGMQYRKNITLPGETHELKLFSLQTL